MACTSALRRAEATTEESESLAHLIYASGKWAIPQWVPRPAPGPSAERSDAVIRADSVR